MTQSRPWLPYALVAAAGVSLGALQYALDNRDPLVFTIPILGLTTIVLLVMFLSGRGETARMERVAAEEGLRYDGVGPLPPVTPLLAGVSASAPILSARLPGRGPRVRLAETGRRRVAIVEAPAPDPSEAQNWLAAHPLRPEAAVEDGLLVVAVDRSASYRELFDLVAELHPRM